MKYLDKFQGYSLDMMDEAHADSGPVGIVLASEDEDYLSNIKMREFQVRIGIESGLDNLVTDINGNPNIAGAGINNAQRVMGSVDGNQILVGNAAASELRYREDYMRALRSLGSVKVKHDMYIQIYQLTGEYEGLNSDYPKDLNPDTGTPKLTKVAAYLFALSIVHR